jgi:hypothetical protein
MSIQSISRSNGKWNTAAIARALLVSVGAAAVAACLVWILGLIPTRVPDLSLRLECMERLSDMGEGLMTYGRESGDTEFIDLRWDVHDPLSRFELDRLADVIEIRGCPLSIEVLGDNELSAYYCVYAYRLRSNDTWYPISSDGTVKVPVFFDGNPQHHYADPSKGNVYFSDHVTTAGCLPHLLVPGTGQCVEVTLPLELAGSFPYAKDVSGLRVQRLETGFPR